MSTNGSIANHLFAVGQRYKYAADQPKAINARDFVGSTLLRRAPFVSCLKNRLSNPIVFDIGEVLCKLKKKHFGGDRIKYIK